MISFKNVYKKYNTVEALKDISFTMPNQGLVFIIGKSGCGKSTLLNLLGCLDAPTEGQIILNGNNITSLSEKKLTLYRNNYIGFVFQDFNLIEDLTVYENISLSLDLKREKYDKERILKLLKSLEIDSLIDRKVNEISGGEKQRVAIARAIIKKPKILLCDEPTGNLDSKNSEQIFNILKDISKNTLVVVITHDESSARAFSDNIIELKDGEIKKNTVSHILPKEEKIELKFSHLSLLKKLKMSYLNLKYKKLRLVITVILCIIAFTTYGLTNTLNNYDEYKVHTETLINEKNEIISIAKKGNSIYSSLITEKEMALINDRIDSKKIIYANAVLNDDEANLEDSLHLLKREQFNDSAFYDELLLGYSTFFEIRDDQSLYSFEIVGNYPEAANEVLITEFFADYLTAYRFFAYKDNDKIDYKIIDNKDDLIDLKLPFGDSYLIISGYVKDNELSRYESLKTASYDEETAHPSKLYKEFYKNYKENYDSLSNNHFRIIVPSNFFEISDLKKNSTINHEPFNQIYSLGDKKLYKKESKIFEHEIKVYNGKEIVSINVLEDDEIVLSTSDAMALYDQEFNERFNKTRDQKIRDYKKAYEKYQKELEEHQAKLEENPDYIMPNLKEPTAPDLYELEQQLLRQILKEHDVYNNTLTLEIIDEDQNVQKERSKVFDLKVAGLIVPDRKTLEYYYNSVLSNSFSDYVFPNQRTKQVDVYEKNPDKIKNILSAFKDHKKLTVKTPYIKTIKSVSALVSKSKLPLRIASLVLLLFACILLSNFIHTNITINKQKIGILRALGTRTKDCIGIYVVENIIIDIFTFLLSATLLVIISSLMNAYITKSVGFSLRVLEIDSTVYLYILGAMLIATIISLIIPIIKLAHMKPIDVIKKIN